MKDDLSHTQIRKKIGGKTLSPYVTLIDEASHHSLKYK